MPVYRQVEIHKELKIKAYYSCR